MENLHLWGWLSILASRRKLLATLEEIVPLRKPAKTPAVFQGMRPISKPRLLIGIYTFWEIF